MFYFKVLRNGLLAVASGLVLFGLTAMVAVTPSDARGGFGHGGGYGGGYGGGHIGISPGYRGGFRGALSAPKVIIHNGRAIFPSKQGYYRHKAGKSRYFRSRGIFTGQTRHFRLRNKGRSGDFLFTKFGKGRFERRKFGEVYDPRYMSSRKYVTGNPRYIGNTRGRYLSDDRY